MVRLSIVSFFLRNLLHLNFYSGIPYGTLYGINIIYLYFYEYLIEEKKLGFILVRKRFSQLEQF